jgi:ABC-type enterobactin transport system permease subunit
MANTFTRKTSQNVGASPDIIGNYTVGASTTAIVIGLTCTNTTGSAITANVFLANASANTYIVANAPISSGASLIPIGGDQKIVMITGDKIYVQSSAATSIDAILSIMEIT